jgi:hypothetical protein
MYWTACTVLQKLCRSRRCEQGQLRPTAKRWVQTDKAGNLRDLLLCVLLL